MPEGDSIYKVAAKLGPGLVGKQLLRVTTQGLRPPGTFRPMRRVDERHVPYYWTKIDYADGGHAPGNDLQAALDREVSVTPLQLDMTDRVALAGLRGVFGG